MYRKYSFLLVALSFLCFIILSSIAIKNPAAEMAIFLSFPFLLLLIYWKKPFLQPGFWANLGIVAGIFVLCFVKNSVFPCNTKIPTFFSFSLLFSFGQGFAILCIVELCKKNQNKTCLVFYSFMMLVIASYGVSPIVLIASMVLYSFALVFYSLQLPAIFIPGKVKQTAFRFALVVPALLLSCAITALLIKYREPLGSWDPLQWLSGDTGDKNISGFSPYSVLGSKNIISSSKTALRYFAPPGIYHLRGKVFDTYSQGEWQLSQEKIKALHGKPDQNGNKKFSLQENFVWEKEHRIVYLLSLERFSFFPILCQEWMAKDFHAFSVNQEEIILPKTPYPSSLVLRIGKTTWDEPTEKARYLQIPPDLKEYLDGLVFSITPNSLSPEDKAKALCLYLKENHAYSTQSTIEQGKDPILDFLQNKKNAHCEMFASSFVMMARSLGIPSRYVAGYYAHEWNSFGKFITVREADAHVWAEIWVDGKGWQTLDPTPAASLQETLQQRRGLSSVWWEALSESFRSWKENFLSWNIEIPQNPWIAFFLAIGLFIYIIIKKKPKALPRVSYSPRSKEMQKILVELCAYLEKNSLPPKKSCQTLREYFSMIPHSSPFYPFVWEWILSWEQNLYGEIPLESATIEALQKKWQAIAMTQNQK
ncbi:MAG: transglutaminase domain-containing protein [Candidatus Brocadiae bacterium]|nr:transglutaminase domain-containing protein [Candidatus Brocadiia bacterium]